MRRSLFASFRGTDGRSLARALACLILINAVFAGFLAGTATAAASDAAICTVALPGLDGAPEGESPAPGHAFECCPGLCSTVGVAIPPAGPVLDLPSGSLDTVSLTPAVRHYAPASRANPARGPPVLA